MAADRARRAYHLLSDAPEDGFGDPSPVRSMKGSRAELGRLRDELGAARERITELETELQRARADLAQSTDSASARIAMSAVRKIRRLVPANSRRQQSLHTVASRTLVLVEHGPSALVGADASRPCPAQSDRRCGHPHGAPQAVPPLACAAHAVIHRAGPDAQRRRGARVPSGDQHRHAGARPGPGVVGRRHPFGAGAGVSAPAAVHR